MLDTEQAARMCPICGEDSFVYDTRETAKEMHKVQHTVRDGGSIHSISPWKKSKKFLKTLDIGDRPQNI